MINSDMIISKLMIIFKHMKKILVKSLNLTKEFLRTTSDQGISKSILLTQYFIRKKMVEFFIALLKMPQYPRQTYYFQFAGPVLSNIHPDENAGNIRMLYFDSSKFLVADISAVDCIFECSYEKIPKYLENGVRGREIRMFNKYSQGEISEPNISGATIVDVGARVGISSRMFLHRGASKIIAVEADPSPVKCLYRNLSRFDKNKYEIHEVALSDKNGKDTFYLETASSDSSLIKPHESSEPVLVETRRLDDLISGQDLGESNILKIDAEGGEPEVLRGAEGIINRFSIVTVRASYERGSASGQGGHTLPDCKKILEDSGFNCDVYDDGKQLIARKENSI